MSYAERNTGKIKLVAEMTKEECEQYCHDYYNREFGQTDEIPRFCEDWLEACNDELWKQRYEDPKKSPRFVYVNGKLWFAYDIREHEIGSFFFDIVKTSDGEYVFNTSFYNGGTCLEEILDEEMEKF